MFARIEGRELCFRVWLLLTYVRDWGMGKLHSISALVTRTALVPNL